VPFHGIEWITAGAGISIGSFSDSIDYGDGLTPKGTGWPHGVAASLTASTGAGVSCYNNAQNGDSPTNSINRFRRAVLRGGLPDICVYRPYSRNDASETTASRQAKTAEFVRTCFENNRLPVLACGIYESATPANNTQNDATTAWLTTYCATFGIPLLRFDQVITSANGATLLAGDGVHPNSAGNDALVAYAAPVVLPYARQLLSL